MSALAVDQYSRFMTEMFDERDLISTTTVWQSFFGRPEHGSQTVYSPNAQIVEIDIIRGNRKLAALIQRGIDARNISAKTGTVQEFSTFSRAYPLGEEKSPITASQLNNRIAGEKPYESQAKIDRMRNLALREHKEHMRRFVRTFEYMSGQSLLTGKMPAILDTKNTDLIYDFRRNADNTFSPTVAWSDAASKPIDDIEALYKRLLINGKVKANVVFMAEDVLPVFLQNTQVKDLANKFLYSLVNVSPNNPVPANLQPLVDGGATCRGMIQTPSGYQFWLFSYVSVYEDNSGNVKDYMPSGTVFMAYYGARADRYFGPSEFLPVTPSKMAWYQEMFGFNMAAPPMPPKVLNEGAVVSPLMFYNNAYEENLKNVNIITQTAPIFATTQTDAFGTLTSVLGGSE